MCCRMRFYAWAVHLLTSTSDYVYTNVYSFDIYVLKMHESNKYHIAGTNVSVILAILWRNKDLPVIHFVLTLC